MRESTRQKVILQIREAKEGSKQNIRKSVNLSISLGCPARMVQVKGGSWRMQVLDWGDPSNTLTFGTKVWETCWLPKDRNYQMSEF
jgi:hypothetical protein